MKYRIKHFRKYTLRKWQDEFCLWLAWILPKRLVYWAAIRVGAHGTTGNYSTQIVPDMTFMEGICRWQEDFKLYK